jgi:hypothetical protein
MPQKTIYLSDADAAFWDEAKTRIGEKSMSTMFVEFLRKTLEVREGFLHIIRAEPKQAKFAVMLAPSDSNDALQPHYCHGLSGLASFLEQLGLSVKAIQRIREDLKTEDSISERVALPQEKINLF